MATLKSVSCEEIVWREALFFVASPLPRLAGRRRPVGLLSGVLILKGTGDVHTGRGLLGRQGGTETRLQPSVRGSWTAPAAPSQKPQKRCPLWSPGRVRPRVCQPLHLCPRLCCGPVAPRLPPRFRKSLRHPGISVASQRA